MKNLLAAFAIVSVAAFAPVQRETQSPRALLEQAIEDFLSDGSRNL